MGKEIIKRNYDHEGKLISKECNKCHEVKLIDEFYKCKRSKDGLQVKCKQCEKQYREDNKERYQEYDKQYKENNKEWYQEYNKQYYKNNKEYIKENNKQYKENNKEWYQEYKKQYYKDNKERYQEYSKQYREDNKEKIKEYDKQYRENNKEWYQEYNKQYYKNNKEYCQEYSKQYKENKIQEALQQIKIEVEADPNKYNYIKGKEIYGIIYLVHNTESDKYYIGQTTIGFDNRYPSGWLYYHDYKNNVREDLELYGENSFEYIKLFKVAHSQYELDKLEAYYIDYYNSYENGYNKNRGNIFTDRGKEK